MPVFNLFSRIVWFGFFFLSTKENVSVCTFMATELQRHKLVEGPYVERISYVMRTAAFL